MNLLLGVICTDMIKFCRPSHILYAYLRTYSEFCTGENFVNCHGLSRVPIKKYLKGKIFLQKTHYMVYGIIMYLEIEEGP